MNDGIRCEDCGVTVADRFEDCGCVIASEANWFDARTKRQPTGDMLSDGQTALEREDSYD